ncbi:hypothetical protein ACFV27_17320 [Streptomyces antimycoticus]|uniref:hypothetical protein n=1 Tax=Streptomyces antimycoticus TaxID=68175 RepID=UPI00367C7C1D
MTAVPGPDEVAEADRRFRLWMRRNREHAAAQFQLRITGEPVFGWRDRSISAPANSLDGPRAQLYVTARLLHRITLGDHLQLTEPLKKRARNLLRALP